MLRAARPPMSSDPGREGESPASSRHAMREEELTALARAMAAALRREGPKRGSAVLEMLRERGLPEAEALSVIMFAISTGVVVRDPPWSTLLKAPDPAPNRRVLVVDDDADFRTLLREVLENEGYTVLAAANGRDALDQLRRAPSLPGVVVLDLMMPVMDGWQVMRAMQDDAALSKIPIVAISASAEIRSTDGFLKKPLDQQTLISTVERFARSSPVLAG